MLPGFNWSAPSELTVVGGVAYFAADDGTAGVEPPATRDSFTTRGAAGAW